MSDAFLIISLFFPRITLFFAYFFFDDIPKNNIPLLFDFIGAIIAPRVLILIYIAMNLGYGTWFWVHLIVAIIVYIAGYNFSNDDE